MQFDVPLIDLGQMSDGTQLRLPMDGFDRHCQVLAPTGYGKSRLLARIVQQFVTKSRDATVVLDPAGDLCNLLKRWAYSQGLQNRLVIIDPREQRLVCGLNPIQPWTSNHGLQAGVLRDIVRRSLGGNETSATAPLASQWIFNFLYLLLVNRLTMYELGRLLDFSDSVFLQASISRLPPSIVRSDFEALTGAMARLNEAQALRFLAEQLGSTSRRLRQFVTNSYLDHMLAARVRAIGWGQVIDRGMLILVNLSQEGNALTDEDQRLLGQLVVSSIIRESFARPEHRRRPVNLIIDEAGKLASPEVTTVLNEGRKYRLRLILAHQTLSQLVDHRENDTTLLDAVTNNARLKIVFGGLGHVDGDAVGRTLFGALADPDTRKLVLKSPIQLSHMERVESVTTSSARTRSSGEIDVRGEARVSGRGRSHGTSEVVGSSFGSGDSMAMATGFAYPMDLGMDAGTIHEARNFGSFSSAGGMDATGTSDAESKYEAFGETDSHGTSRARGEQRGRSVTRGLMVVPDEPREIVTSVQFEPLEEQLHRLVSAMTLMPDRHAVVSLGKSQPVEFRVADVPNPSLTLRQAQLLDLRLMRRLPFYVERSVIEAEIAERQNALLRASVIEVADVATAIERRRASRRSLGPGGRNTDDDNTAGVGAHVEPPTPVQGGACRAETGVPRLASE
jgi:hypothetical protein